MGVWGGVFWPGIRYVMGGGGGGGSYAVRNMQAS
jgi:hypothetical protein